ncbi:MAG: RNA polymerase sigma factor [Bacillus sp. (in: Bacteria)]|nr:RNA polymerase sigma factor [Bacillus sp. (in: firmicutes)]MCM1428127.1 RNA polymerase sigma factor [Eubacterium sp.]
MTREDELFRRMEQGDDGAAEELIAMYYPDILRYCIWNAPDKSLAEDAAQETFLKAVRYFDRYVHQGKFKPFLYQIAANTCIDMKRRKWLAETGYEELTEEVCYQERGFTEVDENLHIRQMIRKLPEDMQEIIVLRFMQELTLREIAQTVRLPLRTVQSKLRSALKSLKKELEKEREEENTNEQNRK